MRAACLECSSSKAKRASACRAAVTAASRGEGERDGVRALSCLSFTLSPTKERERSGKEKHLCFEREKRKEKKIEKSLGRERPCHSSSKLLLLLSFSSSSVLFLRHARCPSRVERARLRSQWQRQQNTSSSSHRCADGASASLSETPTKAAAAMLRKQQQQRRRHRRCRCRRCSKDKRRCSEDGAEEAEIDSDIFVVFFGVCRQGRGQRLRRGRRRRLRSGSSSRDIFFDVVDVDVDIISVSLAACPPSAWLQAQTRQGGAVPVPHRRKELHAGDGAR